MKLSTLGSVFLLSNLISATSSKPLKSCTDYDIPVTVTSNNLLFGPRFENNFELIDFLTALTSRDNSTFHPFTGTATQTNSYTISGTFCAPSESKARKRDTVLLLTHGLGFDRSYWNPEVHPEKYSFVNHAIAQGYSTFSYDRLGVGASSIVSGYTNQASIQMAILQSLAKSIRSGKYSISGEAPKHLVLVGHSFGSALSAGALTAEPDLADGVILTGYSYAGFNPGGFVQAAGFHIADKQHPGKWRLLDNGYITTVDLYANINLFFKAPDYDQAFAAYSDSTKQPLGINELISMTLLPTTPKNFKGAAMVITGQYDFIFCTSQCDDIIEPSAASVFKKAKHFKAVSYPGAGHALNLASNATGSFDIITDFMQQSGL
ncbi:Alpha/Beta hydrolase protein [Trichoderma barbatum]